ncbi:MAG: hypothetical protein HY914_02355 [Desulfomonile tiedjei]|nr:hypothetical protein [Desulfomonile tiedjei]
MSPKIKRFLASCFFALISGMGYWFLPFSCQKGQDQKPSMQQVTNLNLSQTQNQPAPKDDHTAPIDQIGKPSHDLEELRKRISQDQTRIRDLEKQLWEKNTEAASQKERCEADASGYRKKIAALQNKNDAQETKIDLQQQEMAALKRKLSSLQDSRRHPQPNASTQIMPGPVFVDNFAFAPVSCKREGTRIIVGLLITNNGPDDRQLFICGRGNPSQFYYADPSYLVDTQGNWHAASQVKFANKSAMDRVGRKMPSRFSMPAELIFDNVPPTGDRVMLKLGTSDSDLGGKMYPEPIRDIPVSK